MDVYLQPFTKVKLTEGNLDLAGRLDYRGGDAPQVRFEGEAAVNDLAVERRDDNTDLLRWQRLHLKGVSSAIRKGR